MRIFAVKIVYHSPPQDITITRGTYTYTRITVYNFPYIIDWSSGSIVEFELFDNMYSTCQRREVISTLSIQQ